MPTAAEMAQLGAEIIAGHQRRRREIVGIVAAVQEHAAQTGRFVAHLHRGTHARKQENRRLMRELRTEDKTRHAAAQEHDAQTGAFVALLHRGTRARKREVRAQLAGYAAEMRGARNAWREHQREVRAQIRAYAAEMKGARKAWREHLAPKAKAKAPIRGFAKSAA